MREPDLTLYPKQPIVYAWRDGNGAIIYVGMSRIGLQRPLSVNHPVYQYGASLSVWNCDSTKAARKLEAELIRYHRPVLNKLIPTEWQQPQPFVQNPDSSESQTNSEIQTKEPVYSRLAAALAWKVKGS